jgi:hypothetical protein
VSTQQDGYLRIARKICFVQPSVMILWDVFFWVKKEGFFWVSRTNVLHFNSFWAFSWHFDSFAICS